MPPDDDLAALVDAVHGEVVDHAGGERGAVAQIARARAPLATAEVVDAVVDRVMARTVGLGPLEPLLADADVTEVMVNGPGRVWIERRGTIEPTDVGLDRAAIELLVERIVAPLGLRVDRTSPLVDARLPDGSRVNVIIPPLAIDGPCITIRRFGARAILLGSMCPPDVARLLETSVRDRANIVVSGGTGAGKTTLLNALAAAIPESERIVTVEDAAELRLPGRHVVRLEARPANADGVGAVTVRALVRNALRMRPDRIVVGEVRGAEALDMLQAMNTGHEGSLSTCHANSPVDALRRVETMVMMGDVGLPLGAIREQLVSALDLVVHVARRPDGSRTIAAVSEVTSDSERVRLLADEG
ncbi:MAG: pilus assembly protein CpaF, partial [Acidimicrobiaceae bacterium]